MQNEELIKKAGDDHSANRTAYSIHQAKPEDLPIAFPLVAEYFQEIDVIVRDSKEEFADYLNGDGNGVWLAFASEEPVGCIVLRGLSSPPASGEVKRLYVRPTHRGTGIARALMTTAHGHAAGAGFERLVLDVMPSRTLAIAFYRRLGYTDIAPYTDWPMVYLGRPVDP